MILPVFLIGALVEAGLIIVHAPGEHSEIAISVNQIASIHSTRKHNRELTEETRCAIATTDGRYISVIETCEQIKHMMSEVIDGKH